MRSYMQVLRHQEGMKIATLRVMTKCSLVPTFDAWYLGMKRAEPALAAAA
jgi:hypothetical protein